MWGSGACAARAFTAAQTAAACTHKMHLPGVPPCVCTLALFPLFFLEATPSDVWDLLWALRSVITPSGIQGTLGGGGLG